MSTDSNRSRRSMYSIDQTDLVSMNNNISSSSLNKKNVKTMNDVNEKSIRLNRNGSEMYGQREQQQQNPQHQKQQRKKSDPQLQLQERQETNAVKPERKLDMPPRHPDYQQQQQQENGRDFQQIQSKNHHNQKLKQQQVSSQSVAQITHEQSDILPEKKMKEHLGQQIPRRKLENPPNPSSPITSQTLKERQEQRQVKNSPPYKTSQNDCRRPRGEGKDAQTTDESQRRSKTCESQLADKVKSESSNKLRMKEVPSSSSSSKYVHRNERTFSQKTCVTTIEDEFDEDVAGERDDGSTSYDDLSRNAVCTLSNESNEIENDGKINTVNKSTVYNTGSVHKRCDDKVPVVPSSPSSFQDKNKLLSSSFQSNNLQQPQQLRHTVLEEENWDYTTTMQKYTKATKAPLKNKEIVQQQQYYSNDHDIEAPTNSDIGLIYDHCNYHCGNDYNNIRQYNYLENAVHESNKTDMKDNNSDWDDNSSDCSDSDDSSLALSEYIERRYFDEDCELDQKFIPPLIMRSCHLPGYSWTEDWYQFMSNNHPVFGICCHHPRHPIRKWTRLATLFGSAMFGLAVTNVIYLAFVGTGTDYNKVYWQIPTHTSITSLDDTTHSSVWKVLGFQQALSVTNGNLALWTVGVTIHSLYDHTIWSLAACTCFMETSGNPQGNTSGNRHKAIKRREKLRRYQRTGSFVVMLFVVVVMAFATFVVLVRATIDNNNSNNGTSDNENIDNNTPKDHNFRHQYSFVVAYAIELSLSFFFYYPVIGTILFSGILTCGRYPVLGGRPYELRQEEMELQQKEKRKARRQRRQLRINQQKKDQEEAKSRHNPSQQQLLTQSQSRTLGQGKGALSGIQITNDSNKELQLCIEVPLHRFLDDENDTVGAILHQENESDNEIRRPPPPPPDSRVSSRRSNQVNAATVDIMEVPKQRRQLPKQQFQV